MRLTRNRLALYGLFLAALLVTVGLVVLYLYLREDDPFQGAELYVNPDSSAARQVAEWRDTRPDDAELLRKVSTRPIAAWFDQDEGVTEVVDEYVTRAREVEDLPVLAAYNIPNRDCSGNSEGNGAESAAEYRAWTQDLAEGIGDRKAVVILEPDALALLDCLPEPQRSSRVNLIRDAVSVLEGQPNVSVYVDAGNSNWMEPSEMAQRLEKAGISRAEGFSLNVSNFDGTVENVRYGENLSTLTGGKHFVIDTSRNGLGASPDDEWCNPTGRALGEPPTMETAKDVVDAYLWIKPPGESDGTCNGGPPAGVWWPDYALDLSRRAS